MKRKVSPDKVFLFSVLACLLPFIVSIVFYNDLPQRIATHFNFSGVPDGFSPRWVAAFGIPFFMLIMHIVVWVSIENDPKKQGIPRSFKSAIKWLIPVLSNYVHISIISFALGIRINFVQYIPVLIGVIFIFIGVNLPKLQQNYTAGIRLPWTMHSAENWKKTHSLAGKVWTVGGILMVCSALLGLYVITFAIILVLVFVPVIYSFIIYRKAGKEN
jgi:uncharacterized membrane protein